MADPGIPAATADQAAMDPGILAAMADQAATEGPGTEEAMAERGARAPWRSGVLGWPWRVAPPQNFLGEAPHPRGALRSRGRRAGQGRGGKSELDGTSGGPGELDGTSVGQGELDGTSGGNGELDGPAEAQVSWTGPAWAR